MANFKKRKLPPHWLRRRSASARVPSQNAIDRMGIEKLLSRKQVIFRNGQSASYIYKVESGCICTYAKRSDGSRLIIGFYFPGDYFGLELRKKHLVSAEPITPSLVLVIRRWALAARTANDLAVAKHMLTITNAELQRAQNHSLLLRNSAHKCVANFLFEMKHAIDAKKWNWLCPVRILRTISASQSKRYHARSISLRKSPLYRA